MAWLTRPKRRRIVSRDPKVHIFISWLNSVMKKTADYLSQVAQVSGKQHFVDLIPAGTSKPGFLGCHIDNGHLL